MLEETNQPSSSRRRVLQKSNSSPGLILTKVRIHLAVDSFFRRNDGQEFKPFSTPLKSGMCGEKWIPAFARITGGCIFDHSDSLSAL